MLRSKMHPEAAWLHHSQCGSPNSEEGKKDVQQVHRDGRVLHRLCSKPVVPGCPAGVVADGRIAGLSKMLHVRELDCDAAK